MSDQSVSDVNPDDLEEMMKGIDDLDDDLFGKATKKKTILSPEKKELVEPKGSKIENGPNKKKVKFEDINNIERHDDDAIKPTGKSEPGNSELNRKDENEKKVVKTNERDIFDKDDDDILGSLDRKSTQNTKTDFMDDIFGPKKDTKKESSILGDIFQSSNEKRNDKFVLDEKYQKKSEKTIEPAEKEKELPRRRRGNPTLSSPTTDIFNKDLDSQDKIVNSQVKSENPFPWMSGDRNSNPNPVTTSQQINQNSDTQSTRNHTVEGTVANESSAIDFTNTIDTKELKEMEFQTTSIINARKAQHAAEIEKQQIFFQNQIQSLHEKQNQMRKLQTEQGKRLLQSLEQQMEEESEFKKGFMTNQMNLISQLQLELPNQNVNIANLYEKSPMANNYERDFQTKIKEKVADIEEIYDIKEKKMRENFEEVIKDLENKLAREQERYRSAEEESQEEIEKLKAGHQLEVANIHLLHQKNQDTLKAEYQTVIENLNELRRIELKSVKEIKESTIKISSLSSSVQNNTADLGKITNKFEEKLSEHYQSREQAIEIKDKELVKLQQTLLQREESSNNERKRLTETILKLEGQITQKQLELDSEKRQLEYEKGQHEYTIKQFETEKDVLLENLQIEKSKIFKDREKKNSELKRLKTDLAAQIKHLQIERSKYIIHQRFNHKDQNTNFNEVPIQNPEVETVMKCLEEEKIKMQKAQGNFKFREKNLKEKKRKLSKQKEELVDAIEKLYEVEMGINRKFEDLSKIQANSFNVKLQNQTEMENLKIFEDRIKESVQEIKLAMVDLLKQEQKVKNEKLYLSEERKKLNNTRQSLVCSNCTRSLRRSISSKDLHERETVSQSNPQMAWMDLDESAFHKEKTRRTFSSTRISGDGASLEALDTHVTTLKKEAESDQGFLKNELEYLKSIQQINMKTLSKYY